MTSDPKEGRGAEARSDIDPDETRLGEADLRERSAALDTAQEAWEELAYLANPKMACPECSGSGSIHGGSLGDLCVRCMGMRVIDQPGSEPLGMPPFMALRGAITAYGNALADHELPAGHIAKRSLALPPGATVPTLEDIHALGEMAKVQSRRRLAGGAPGLVPSHLLAERTSEKGMRSEGALDEFTDAELDEEAP